MVDILFTDDLNFNGRNYGSIFKLQHSRDKFVGRDNPVLRINDFTVDHFAKKRVDSATLREWYLNGHVEFNQIYVEVREIVERFVRQQLVTYDDQMSLQLDIPSYEEQIEALLKHEIIAKNIYFVSKHWEAYFDVNGTRLMSSKTVFVFNGVGLLDSMMLAFTKRLGILTYVSEHFVTGTEYFLEFRYSPVPNASYAGRVFDRSDYKYLPETGAKTVERFDANKNKNVKRLTEVSAPLKSLENYILIVAQVVNDASMSDAQGFYSPTAKLIETIEWFLNNTNYNVAVKWHPWEHKKVHIDSCLTQNRVRRYFLESVAYSERVTELEECNLVYLAQHANAAVTICSQAAIELALYGGVRTITLMPTYYDFMGITESVLNLSEIDFETYDHILSFPEFSDFMVRLTWLVQDYLVSAKPSGARRLGEILDTAINDYCPAGIPKKEEVETTVTAPAEAPKVSPPADKWATQALFEDNLRNRPEEIHIPEKYRVARYLQRKKWARPLWRYCAVPASRVVRRLR